MKTHMNIYIWDHADMKTHMNIYIWDRIREKGPNTYFFKFSNYLIFKEISRSSISYFLRTKRTVHHGVTMA